MLFSSIYPWDIADTTLLDLSIGRVQTNISVLHYVSNVIMPSYMTITSNPMSGCSSVHLVISGLVATLLFSFAQAKFYKTKMY